MTDIKQWKLHYICIFYYFFILNILIINFGYRIYRFSILIYCKVNDISMIMKTQKEEMQLQNIVIIP